MSIVSDASSYSIYEEDLNEETTLNFSALSLETVPPLNNKEIICILYLQNNQLSSLPDDLFPSLPNLMWLDLRDNILTELPSTVEDHPNLTHLLLQNNKLTALPCELGTTKLKVLQVNGNPITFPPKDVINSGVAYTLRFLRDNFQGTAKSQTDYTDGDDSQEVRSYNSVIDEAFGEKSLSVKLKEFGDSHSAKYYTKFSGKCHKLPASRSRKVLCHQSDKYLKPTFVDKEALRFQKNLEKKVSMKKRTEILEAREKIIQGRKNIELLKNWRMNYSDKKNFADPSFRLEPQHFPFDLSPEYMTFLTREDIEKDLPDKYRKKLVRRCKPSVPRQANDVHLAMKIKQMFENLDAIDLQRREMTPRTEQKLLLDEIQKISVIKQKLSELSLTNALSVLPQ